MTSSISFIVSEKIEQGTAQALGEAIDLMKDVARNEGSAQLENDLIQLKGRLHELMNKMNAHLVSYDEAVVSMNQIRHHTLQFKDQVKALEMKATAQQEPIRDKEIESLIHANAYATKAKDLDMVMRTYSTESPNYMSIHEFHQTLFANLDKDIAYEIDYVKLLYKMDDIATVEVQQTTKSDVDGVDFRKNETVQIYSLKKEKGQWKIYGGVIKRIEYLDI